MRRANHQVISSDSRPSGIAFQITAVINRDSDILCRAGGEEFLLLLPGISAESARQAGERLRQHIADHPFEPVGTITVSLGVAHFPSFHIDAEQALRLADKALYLAKEQGRNRVVVYPYAD